jgi:hypothetical protein
VLSGVSRMYGIGRRSKLWRPILNALASCETLRIRRCGWPMGQDSWLRDFGPGPASSAGKHLS